MVPSAANKKKSLTTGMIASQFNAWWNSGALPRNTKNLLSYIYMIHLPSGISVDKSCVTFCAYHGYSYGVPYSVLPWVGDCPAQCVKSNYYYNGADNVCGVIFFFFSFFHFFIIFLLLLFLPYFFLFSLYIYFLFFIFYFFLFFIFSFHYQLIYYFF